MKRSNGGRGHNNIDPESAENRLLADRLLKLHEEPDQKIRVLQNLLKVNSDQQGAYSSWLADIYYKKKDYGKMEQVLLQARQRKDAIPFSLWTMGDNPTLSWVDGMRADKEAEDAVKAKVFNMVRNVNALGASAPASLALLELDSAKELPIMQRLKIYRDATQDVSNHYSHFDRLMSYAQKCNGKEGLCIIRSITVQHAGQYYSCRQDPSAKGTKHDYPGILPPRCHRDLD